MNIEKDIKKTNEYVIKKTERLVTGVYMVTSFLSETEPIKKKVRENGVFLLAHVYGTNTEEAVHVNVFKKTIGEVISLLEIAKAAGLLSAMNVEMLVREFVKLSEVYEKGQNQVQFSHEMVLPDNFFGTQNVSKESSVVTHIENVESSRVQATVPPVSARSIFDNFRPKNKVISPDKNTLRKDRIMAIIREKGEINIKDIARVITDCSEKTLQRDLIALVQDGLVRKRGERRWSTYSLK